MQALVVEASEVVRETLSEHLLQLGFQVEQASEGATALGKLEAFPPPDVILLGWSLPDLDGLEVLRRVRAGAGVCDVPVVMVTTEEQLPLVDDALAAGASEYLIQPFDAQTVLEKLLLLGVDPELRRAA